MDGNVDRLTQARLKALKPTDREQVFWDSEVRGFCVAVSPQGTLTFRLKYRHEGRANSFTIGRASIYSVEKARDIAREKLVQVRQGISPNTVKKEAKLKAVRETDQSLDAVATQFFTRWPVKQRYKHESKLTYQRVIQPKLGKLAVQKIDRYKISSVLDSVYDQGKPVAAKRVLFLIRLLLTEAYQQGYIDYNPARDIKPREHEKRRKRVLSVEEIKLFWCATKVLAEPYASIYQLLLLTGQRRGEVASMEWTELDLEKGLWMLPADKTKNGNAHTVYLSAHAIKLLERLKVRPRFDDKYVFSSRKNTPVCGFSKAKLRLDKLIADLLPAHKVMPEWDIHDLRRTFVTLLADLDVSKEVRERYVNHLSGELGGVVGVYTRSKFEMQQRRAIQDLDKFFEELLFKKREISTKPTYASKFLVRA